MNPNALPASDTHRQQTSVAAENTPGDVVSLDEYRARRAEQAPSSNNANLAEFQAPADVVAYTNPEQVVFEEAAAESIQEAREVLRTREATVNIHKAAA